MKYYEVTHKLVSGKVSSKVYTAAGVSASLRKIHDGHVRTYPKLEILCVREITKAEHAAWSEMAVQS